MRDRVAYCARKQRRWLSYAHQDCIHIKPQNGAAIHQYSYKKNANVVQYAYLGAFLIPIDIGRNI